MKHPTITARLESRGVFVLRGREHSDVHLDLRHVARDAACDVLWRGVADQRSRGIFHGAITVEPGADGSDAKLSSKNVLLSSAAEIDTQPEQRSRLLDWYVNRLSSGDDKKGQAAFQRDLQRLYELDRIEEYLERLDEEIRVANRRALAFLEQGEAVRPLSVPLSVSASGGIASTIRRSASRYVAPVMSPSTGRVNWK